MLKSIMTISLMVKYSEFEINIQSVRFLTKKLMRFVLVKDKFPNISSVTSKMGSQQGCVCVARFPL